MKKAIYAYPWNVHQVDETIDLLHGLGVGGINLAAAYHAGKFIHPHDQLRRVYFPEDGSVYFRPRGVYGRVVPRVSSMTLERDILAEWTRRRDIVVNAWLVLNHNTRIGSEKPELAVRNCYGEVYPYSLCPQHPEVRAYGRNLCRDVSAHYDVAELLLESPGYMPYAHGYHHEFAQLAASDWLDAVLGLCFCEHCRIGAARAGIDADRLARRLQEMIDDYLEDDVERTSEEMFATIHEIDELRSFHAWRACVVTSLVSEIRQSVRREVSVRVISTVQRTHRFAYLEGVVLCDLDRVCDGIELPIYQDGSAASKEEAGYAWSQIECARTGVILRPGPPDYMRQDDFMHAYDYFSGCNISSMNFYNFGMLPMRNLRWLSMASKR